MRGLFGWHVIRLLGKRFAARMRRCRVLGAANPCTSTEPFPKQGTLPPGAALFDRLSGMIAATDRHLRLKRV
jgi:hypothetical protein